MQALPRPPPLTIPFDGTVSPRAGLHMRACMPTAAGEAESCEDADFERRSIPPYCPHAVTIIALVPHILMRCLPSLDHPPLPLPPLHQLPIGQQTFGQQFSLSGISPLPSGFLNSPYLMEGMGMLTSASPNLMAMYNQVGVSGLLVVSPCY